MENITLSEISLPPMLSCFSELEDPRDKARCDHLLEEIIVIAVTAILCGARCWTHVVEFAEAKTKWLRKSLKLPHGIPSNVTIGRVFNRLAPDSFISCLKKWLSKYIEAPKRDIIALDGKTSCATGVKTRGIKAAHIVNALSCVTDMMLGQARVADKTNEIKALPELIKKTDVKNAVVTIDAMGCQRGIAKLIKAEGGDYVLAVKMNQGKLCKAIKRLFNKAEELNYKAMVFRNHDTFDYEHGRIEEREYRVLPQCYLPAFKHRWAGLQSFVEVKRKRIMGDGVEFSTHYYISSLEMKDFELIADTIRKHWRIENNGHWCLDNTFQEDRCLARTGYGPENFSLLRKFVMNLLRLHKDNRSLECMRLRAGWDGKFLNKLMGL